MTDISISNVYLNTIINCVEYLSYYIILRETHGLIGNYINIKFKNKSINLLYLIITLLLLFIIFKITILVYVLISIYMDKRFNLREKQDYIVNSHTLKLMEIYKI